MYTNICSAGLGDHESELHNFSENLKSNNWHLTKLGNLVVFYSLKAGNEWRYDLAK